MANHLQIHLYGSAADQSRAIAAAKRLDAMSFAPEDEHLAHMPAHTWARIGNYARAVSSSKRAISLFDQYLAQPDADRTHRAYLAHDIEIGWGAALMLGSYGGAKWFANRLDTLRDTNQYVTMTALRFGDSKAVEAALPDPRLSKEQRSALGAYLAVIRGDLAGARAALGPELRSDSKDPLAWALSARLQLLNGNRSAAQADFRKAHGFEDDQFYGEDLPRFPVGEIEGFSYYRSGDYPSAEAAFRRTLKDFPNDPRALYGLSQTLQRENKSTEASRIAADFHKAWQGADTTLSIGAL